MLKEYKIYIALLVFILLLVVSVAAFCIFMKTCGADDSGLHSAAYKILSTATSAPTTSSTTPCSMQRAPDGSMVSVCTPTLLMNPDMAIVSTPTPTGAPSLDAMPILLSAGNGTTTLASKTPFNDVLIAETGSEFATLRNARYSMWPYPGEIKFKEIYLVLPDVYTPIFPGYSNNQFIVSSDGTKQVVLHLRHQKNLGVGADVDVYIQAPIESDDSDHPITLIESTNTGALFSIVRNKEESLIEVTYKAASGVSVGESLAAHAALLSALTQMEVVW